MCADVARTEPRAVSPHRDEGNPATTTDTPKSLTGRVAVVTGGGSGLGRAGALALAAAGANVIVLGRNQPALQKTVHLIAQQGGEAHAVRLDVSQEASVRAAAAEVQERFGGAQIVVNNAGVAQSQPFLDTEPQAMRDLLDVNLMGALLVARFFGPQLTAKKGGRLINIASIAGIAGGTNLAVYSASKGAIIAWTKALAVEWARYGATVNAVAPGYFVTDMSGPGTQNPEVAAKMLSRIPARRFGDPTELGPLLVYLSSNDSAFMTGSVLVIDGGQVAR